MPGGDFNFEKVLVYIDNIIVFSKTSEDQIKHLDLVFSSLAQYGLKLKPSKFHLMRQSI